MHPVRITLEFPSFAAAADVLTKLDTLLTPPVIAPADRPDVGAPPPPAVVLPPPASPTGVASPELVQAVVDAVAMFGTAPAVPGVGQPPAVVPVPAAIVPSVPAVPTPAAATPGPTLDSKGLPWDARIHASNKATNQDGSWRQKRGLNDDALKARVEAELRAAQALPVKTPEQALAAALSVPTAPSAVTAPIAVPAPVAPPPAEAAPPVPSNPAAAVPAFLARIAPMLSADKTVTDKLNQALAAAGLTGGIGTLLGNPQHLPTVEATFNALVAA